VPNAAQRHARNWGWQTGARMLEIRTLGGLYLSENGRLVLGLGSRKAEAILVYLATLRTPQNRSVLASLLWPGTSEDHSSASLRVALTTLSQRLGRYLDISRATVALKEQAPICFDLRSLEQHLATGNIEEALELYRGDFLQGFVVRDSPEFEHWLRSQQDHVRELVVQALRTAILQETGRADSLRTVALARRLLELDPFDERTLRRCMWLLAVDGQRAAALNEYERICVLLREELGIEPLPETQDLHAQILRGEDLAAPAHRCNLPLPSTSFVGRVQELAQLQQLVLGPNCRLLTLVGPGGSGKTRLAIQLASRVAHEFADGVYFVSSESFASADFLVPALADALPFNIDTSVTQLEPLVQVLDFLRDKTLLLLLDGLEEKVEAGPFLSQLVSSAPGVKVLVTSIRRLGLTGEWTIQVQGLPVPSSGDNLPLEDYDATRLFVERARQANTGLELSGEDEAAVIHICQLVDGLPLGIELAAAWSYLLPPAEISVEIANSLDFLTSSARDAPAKHRSLRAVFDSAWRLLPDEHRGALSRLAVFEGDFDRDAAAQVAGCDLVGLTALLERSLLRSTARGRYAVHRVVRHFARQKLDQMSEAAPVHQTHSRFYAGKLTRRQADLLGRAMLRARDGIRRDMDNVRAAVLWASLHWEADAAREVLDALLCFYALHSWYEGVDTFRDITRRAREKRAEDGSSLARIALSASSHQAFLLCNLGRTEESAAISQQHVVMAKDLDMRGELSECLHNMGVHASFCGELDTAVAYLEEAILIGSECRFPMWPSYLLWLGHTHFLQGDYEQGELTLKKAYELFERRGTLWGSAFALSKLGLAMDLTGEHVQALAYHNEALAVFDRLGNKAGMGYTLSRMSVNAYLLGQYERAAHLGQEGLALLLEIGHRWGTAASLCRLGFASVGLGELDLAWQYFQDGLVRARSAGLTPLVLYALAGMACVLAQEGETQLALTVYDHVCRHPETPQLYLQKSARWIANLDQVAEPRRDAARYREEEPAAIENVIELVMSARTAELSVT
jgi:predicted ATPase/DNA-binding SARP family transcriptional activator